MLHATQWSLPMKRVGHLQPEEHRVDQRSGWSFKTPPRLCGSPCRGKICTSFLDPDTSSITDTVTPVCVGQGSAPELTSWRSTCFSTHLSWTQRFQRLRILLCPSQWDRMRPPGLHHGGVRVVELHVFLSQTHFSEECLAPGWTVTEPPQDPSCGDEGGFVARGV